MAKSNVASIEKEQVKEPDIIVQTAKEIGDLDRDTAIDLVPELIETVDFSYFRLGGVLSAIQDNVWWEGEAKNFKSYIEENFGIKYRKAMYLINIYDRLVDADIPWEKVAGLGWTKLKELADIIHPDNVDKWVEIAKGMNTLSLQDAVRAEKQRLDGTLEKDGTTEPDSSGVTSVSFKVHPDQKESINQALTQSMEELDTEFKGVALEAICLNYLAGGSTKKQPKVSLAAVMEKAGWEAILDQFEVLFPDIDLTVEVNPN